MNSPKHFDKNNIFVRLVKNELTNLFCYQARKKGIDHISKRLECSIRSYEIAIQQANLLLAFLSSLDWCLRFSYFIGIELSIYSILPIFIYASQLTHRKVYFFSTMENTLSMTQLACSTNTEEQKKTSYTRNNQKHIFLYIHILSSKSFYHVQVNM